MRLIIAPLFFLRTVSIGIGGWACVVRLSRRWYSRRLLGWDVSAIGLVEVRETPGFDDFEVRGVRSIIVS